MRFLLACFAALSCIMLSTAQAKPIQASSSYGYPFHNPFEATIVGTPIELQPKLIDSSLIKEKDFSLRLNVEREHSLPANFWPVTQFRYRLAWRDHAAPLIFIIAGTGATYDSAFNEYLKKLFYAAGMHVVQLSSPTSYDFMVSASRYATPGFSPLDAADLMRVMQRIAQQHDDLQVTHWNLTGYSLGGLDAAFVSHLDAQDPFFNFHKVLLLNPPVNLYASVQNLDRMATVELPQTYEGHDFFQEIYDKLARYFKQSGHFNLDRAILLDFQNSPQRLSNEEMAMLIGTLFRFIASDISFTSDLINHRNLITPTAETIVGIGTSLTPFFELALTCDFRCYMVEQLLPFWQKVFNGDSLTELIEQTSMYAVGEHLKNSTNISVMHNQDDIILGVGDLGYLQKMIGERLILYPYGGHMGNLTYTQNAADIVEFFHD